MNAVPKPSSQREAATRRALAVAAALELPPGTALGVTGSVARGEATSHSDLDLVLLYDGEQPDVEKFWYPIWDAGYRLDHTVRTPAECAKFAGSDPVSGLAELDLRLVCGDAALVDAARGSVREAWRAQVWRKSDAIMDAAIDRWRRSGSVVTMTRPDIKHGRGGLRDMDLLASLALANVCDAPDLSRERELLLDVRTLLHAAARRRRDVLDPEFAVDISEALGYRDRYALSAAIADAARTTDRAMLRAFGQTRDVLQHRRKFTRKPLDLDVVESGGEIALARNAQLDDPGLALRVAAAASRTGFRIAHATWSQLSPARPTWNKAQVSDFFSMLASARAPQVVTTLDEHGLFAPMVPDWERIRGLIPREPSHVHTVDQHSLRVVAACAEARITVPRPDLLLLGALFHDIGKGAPGSHSALGAELVARQAAVMGFGGRDIACVQTLVAEHTTLARLARTRDPEDPATAAELAEAVRYDLLTLDLLEALTTADSKETGPGVWTPAVAAAVDTIVAHTQRQLTSMIPGNPRPMLVLPGVDSEPVGLHSNLVYWRGDYQRQAVRVLALMHAKGWALTEARILASEDGVVAEIEVRFPMPGDADPEEFVRAYHSGVFTVLPDVQPAPTATFWRGATLEVRTVDRPGALGRLLAVLPEIQWAQISSPGATMIAQFQLPLDVDRAQVERDVTRALVTR